MISLIRIIFTLLFLSPCLAYAQEEGNVAAQGLAQSLSALNSSAAELASSNETLAIKNSELRKRLGDVQGGVEKLNQENQRLTAAKMKLEEVNPLKANQIEQLQRRSVELDSKIKELTAQIKTSQDNLDSLQKEKPQSNDEQAAEPVPAPKAVSQDDEADLSELRQRKQMQKMAALKMISHTQKQEDLLQAQISDYQSKPANKASGTDQKTVLEAQIEQLKDEIAQLKDGSDLGPSQEDQLRQLEGSIGGLQKNRDELAELVAKMLKKAKSIHLSEDQKNEQIKLQTHIEQLNKETKSLKLDLAELQQEMIDLDKRKVSLDGVIQKYLNH